MSQRIENLITQWAAARQTVDVALKKSEELKEQILSHSDCNAGTFKIIATGSGVGLTQRFPESETFDWCELDELPVTPAQRGQLLPKITLQPLTQGERHDLLAKYPDLVRVVLCDSLRADAPGLAELASEHGQVRIPGVMATQLCNLFTEGGMALPDKWQHILHADESPAISLTYRSCKKLE